MTEHPKHPDDANTAESDLDSVHTGRKSRLGWIVLTLLLLGSNGYLGWMWYDTNERLDLTLGQLSRSRLAAESCADELAGASRKLDQAERDLRDARAKVDRAQSSLDELEAALGQSRTSGRSLSEKVDRMVSALNDCRVELADCEDTTELMAARIQQHISEYDECVSIANDRLRKMNAAIQTANNGIMWVTDIPSESIFVSFYGDDPYESLRRKYNELVDRFNAAIERANDLSALLADSLRELE